jgi:hypothetical protein
MADLISRLKLESGEFDSKIKRAGQELLAYSEHCNKVGLQMGFANEDARKFASALGSMATTSQTVRGKLNELTSTFTDLSVMYKNMTEQEKNSAFGKNLSASLDQLKNRINASKSELADISQELNSSNGLTGALDAVAGKFGMSISQLASWGTAVGAAKVVFDVLKDAFFQSESNIDEWGRTVEGAKGAYDIFLNTINSGNWRNFFSNLSTAITGARDLYNALDRLGSVKSNNQAAIAIVQQQIAQLRVMKQQGQNVDEQIKVATERLAKLQGQSVEAGKVAGHSTIINTLRNRVNYGNLTGVNISEGTLRGVAGAIETRGQGAFDQYRRQYEALTQKGLSTVLKYDSLTKSYYETQEFNLNNLTKAQQKQYLIAQAVTEGETEIQKGISIYAQAVNEGTAAAREQFKGNRYAAAGAGSSGGKGTSPQEQAAKSVADAQLAYEQAIKKAQLEFEAGTISDADVKKKTLTAQENLWSAYGKAYATYADPKYKEAQDAAATEIVKLGGEVKAAQKVAQEQEAAARQLAAAEKKRAEELDKLKDSAVSAVRNNDLKSAYQVQSKALQGGMSADQVQLPVTFTYTQANLAAFTEKLKSDLATADVGSIDYNRIMGQLADANALGNLIQTAINNGIDVAQFNTQELWSKIFSDIPGDYIENADWQNIEDIINERLKELELDQIKLDFSTGEVKKQSKEMTKDWNAAATAIQAVGNAMSQIEDPAAKVIGTVAQAVATMALSYAQAANSPAVTGTGWGWIAFAATGVATMLSSIAAIKNATSGGFANGGIIPGSSMSGDNLRGITPDGNVYGLNAGELILSKSQQNNIANLLEGSGGSVANAHPYVNGEIIYLGVNNYLKRTGRGEIVTSR